jgi:NhaP-type Na+/H+ or K+/H+ antiporter
MCATSGVVSVATTNCVHRLKKRHDLSLHATMIPFIAFVPMSRRHAMFWTFLIFVSLAVVFAQLGAYSVLVVLLAGGLKLALLIIAGIVIVYLWRKVFQKNA